MTDLADENAPLPSSLPSSQQSAGRPALLPAFEPLASPGHTRPPKRKHDGSPIPGRADLLHYPTPVPTSSTVVPPSSSPLPVSTRPSMQRTSSSFSERAPLGDIPSVTIPADGTPILMGRSTASSQFQLSASRLISRVHIRASYTAPTELHEHGQVIIECVGWNGAVIRCRGQMFELGKGDTFSSDKPQVEIMMDVQDARVLVRWPTLKRKRLDGGLSETSEENSPTRTITPGPIDFPSSPPQQFAHLHSPLSPSPRGRPVFTASSTFLGMPSGQPIGTPSVEVYEDAEPKEDSGSPPPTSFVHPPPESAASHSKPAMPSGASSQLSEPEDFSDHDEENDPIVHSFGPYGDNLLPRMASIQAASPTRQRKPLKSTTPQQKQRRPRSREMKSLKDLSPVRNHVVNQLAYSRLHSLPLSTIMKNLPASLKIRDALPGSEAADESQKGLTEADLKSLLYDTACVGEIVREGKDAAGKPLEDEFYYLSELDSDEMRRGAVENSRGKPGLRAVRKQHKQYFWKRPRH